MAEVAVVAVPVFSQHKFQQSMFSSILFIYRVVVIPVATQRQVCTALSVQRTVEIPLAQFLDLGVVPVLCNDKFWYRQCRKQWKCRRCSSCGVVDVSVIMQRQVSGFPGRWSMSLLCRSSFGVMPQIMGNHKRDSAVEQIVASRATDHGGNHGSDSAVEQIVASRATDHGGNHGSNSAVQQIVASRATDHGGNHGSDSAVEQIVASRATDHGGRRARYLQRHERHVPMVVQTLQCSDKDAGVPVVAHDREMPQIRFSVRV